MVGMSIPCKVAAVVLLSGLGSLTLAQNAQSPLGNLVVANAWSPATPPIASVGVVYFSISNHGSRPDRLLTLNSDAASAVELHESRTVKGIVEMRQVPALDCPPGVTVKSEPGGLHVMLLGLARPLVAGTMFTVKLQFRDAGTLALQVPVKASR
jgi:periplasmic copper chaperone A